jgi:hypothetical protein
MAFPQGNKMGWIHVVSRPRSGRDNVPVFEMVAAQPAQAMDIRRAIADKMLSCCRIATQSTETAESIQQKADEFGQRKSPHPG